MTDTTKRPGGTSSPRENPDVASFVADLGPRLTSALTVQTGNPFLAEELAQETLVRCLQHWDRVSAADRPDAWAFRTAFNLSRSRWRRMALERRVAAAAKTGGQSPIGGSLAAGGADRHDPIEQREQLIALRQALELLPKRRRAVATLIGKHQIHVTSYSHNMTHGGGGQLNAQHEAILDEAAIRGIRRNTALLFATAHPPTQIELQPWYDGPRAAELAADIDAFEHQLIGRHTQPSPATDGGPGQGGPESILYGAP